MKRKKMTPDEEYEYYARPENQEPCHIRSSSSQEA
jgi:hypothetical protein